MPYEQREYDLDVQREDAWQPTKSVLVQQCLETTHFKIKKATFTIFSGWEKETDQERERDREREKREGGEKAGEISYLYGQDEDAARTDHIQK